MNLILKEKADASEIIRLRRSISEISTQLSSGLDSIIISARNEIRLAVLNSATQDDFTYLKETLASKDDIEKVREEMKLKIQEMKNKVSDFREGDDITVSEEENESEENLDDVMGMDIGSFGGMGIVGQRDELMEEDNFEGSDVDFKRDKSWKSDVPKMGKCLG